MNKIVQYQKVSKSDIFDVIIIDTIESNLNIGEFKMWKRFRMWNWGPGGDIWLENQRKIIFRDCPFNCDSDPNSNVVQGFGVFRRCR